MNEAQRLQLAVARARHSHSVEKLAFALIKAFHDVDERRRMAMRQAFENGVCVAAIAKQFEVAEREVWSAAKNDRLIGGVSDQRFWRHGMLHPSIASQSTKSLSLFIITILPDHNWRWRLTLMPSERPGDQ
jgi:hypothetical protein